MRGRTIRQVCVALLFAVAAGALCADDFSDCWLVPPRGVFDLPQRLDPDEPVFYYSNFDGLWKARIGQELVFYGLQSADFNFYFSLTGFLELHNITTLDPVPWELLRASFGFNLFFELPPLERLLFPGSRLYGELQVSHESDHILDFIAFEQQLIAPPASIYDFDYGNAGAFEYLKARLTCDQQLLDDRLRFFVSAGGRYFFYIDQYSPRSYLWSFFTEAGISFEPASGGWFLVNLAVFYETIKNDFVAGSAGYTIYAIDHDGGDFTNFAVRLALEFRTSAGFACMPFLKYFRGNGRGVDFLLFYEGFEGGIVFAF